MGNMFSLSRPFAIPVKLTMPGLSPFKSKRGNALVENDEKGKLLVNIKE